MKDINECDSLLLEMSKKRDKKEEENDRCICHCCHFDNRETTPPTPSTKCV